MPPATDYQTSSSAPRKFMIAGLLLIAAMGAAAAGVAGLWWRVKGLRDESVRLEAQLLQEKEQLQQQRQTLQAEIAELEQKRLLLKVQNDAWAALHKQVETANPTAAASAERKAEDQARLAPRVYIQASSDADFQLAKSLVGRLRAAGFTVPEIERVKVGPRQPQVRYFRPEDAADAARVVELIKQDAPNATAIVIPGYAASARLRPGHLELWL